MMLFIVYNLDAESMAEKRAALLPDHRDYMKSLGEKVLWGGPLLDDNGESKRGGMYVVRADTADEARKIASNDPLVLGGIYQFSDVSVWRWQSGPDSVEKQN